MINLTDKLVIIVKPDDLSRRIREANAAVLSNLDSRYGPPPKNIQWFSPHGYQHLFSRKNLRTNVKLDESFLHSCFEFTQIGVRNEGSGAFFDSIEKYTCGLRPAASGIKSVKQGVKLLLVELWYRQVILLPTTFSPQANFSPNIVDHELWDWVAQFHPSSYTGDESSFCRRIFYYFPRILYATSWRNVEDISLLEYSQLHHAQRRYMNGDSETPFITSPVPWSFVLTKILKEFPDRAKFCDDDLKKYSQWCLSQDRVTPFHEYTPKEKNAAMPLPRRRVAPVRKSNDEKIAELAASNSHDDAVKYIENFTAGTEIDRINNEPVYPGREHVHHDGNTDIWRGVFKDFLNYRRDVKGYESEQHSIDAINSFADYLFLYLPWWKEIYPDSKIAIPSSPKQFLRYAFISRSSEKNLDEFPLTLLEFVKIRRKSVDSQYGTLKKIQKLFVFVETNYLDNEDIAGAGFRNPIITDFDFPRLTKRTKTSKVVFTKSIYPLLIRYGYALEAFGQYLQDLCLTGALSLNEMKELARKRWINSTDVGFTPIVIFRGKVLPIGDVPNVFSWNTRALKVKRNKGGLTFLPHLTTLRLLICAAETGLRLASLRWLDRRTWDSGNKEFLSSSTFSYYPPDRYVFKLHVNTDKTKDMPWDTDIVFRVHSLLLREEEFQLSIDEHEINDEFDYMDRPHSRFGKIVPLFRSNLPQPIGDHDYQKRWLLFLIGFKEFYYQNYKSYPPLTKVTATLDPSGSSQEKINPDGTRYCPISILAVSTPHACRATFATNRQGLMETSDIANLVGHASPIVTEYYQSPSPEDLQKKLEVSDKEMFADNAIFDKESLVYIRADKKDSSLARSFYKDRNATVKEYGFIPAISLWNSSDAAQADEQGLEELRNGPMSLIRFRETHICPVGEECPTDIVKSIGGFKRCGICPLAMKCLDHLPAISAKKNSLVHLIKWKLKQCKNLENLGESAAADELWDEIEIDTNELLGWQFSEEILAKGYADRPKGESRKLDVVYHVESPEIVRRHLQRVVRQTGETEFLLRRLAEANVYPSMQDSQIQATAANIRRKLLAGNSFSDVITEVTQHADIGSACSLLNSLMRVNKVSISNIVDLLDRDRAPSSTKSRLNLVTK